MFAKQYSHRLPANYDMELIRRRARELGPRWDGTPGMLFKAFIARERGVFAATDNLYASVYLWADPQGAAHFLMDERFQVVIDSFGRPQVEAWLPLEFSFGPAREAKALYREEWAIEPQTDRIGLLAAERERSQAILSREDTLASFLALDAANWRLLRITLSSAAPDRSRGGQVYEVLYLAQSDLESLRHGCS